MKEQIQLVADSTSGWANVLIIGASWAVSILQPLALFVTVVWGGLQIWSFFEKRRKRRKE